MFFMLIELTSLHGHFSMHSLSYLLLLSSSLLCASSIHLLSVVASVAYIMIRENEFILCFKHATHTRYSESVSRRLLAGI